MKNKLTNIDNNNKLELVIVDNESYILDNIQKVYPWEELGYIVTACFTNGLDAFEYVLRTNTDVILTDIHMPIMDGLTLSKAIREQSIPIHIVLLSGFSDFEYARQGLSYNVKNYITKPINYKELISTFTDIRCKAINKKKSSKISLSNSDLSTANSNALHNEILKQILYYIDKHLGNVTLEAISENFSMDKNYISFLFKEEIEISYSEYLYKRKMIHAKILLDSIYMQIKEISLYLGYKNTNNFSRAFKKYYNCSPIEYRNINKSNN